MTENEPQTTPGEHYFSELPGTPEKPRYVEFTVAGRWLRLQSAAGVFSGDRLDPGTAVLLRKAPLPTRGGDFLDLGAGYGPIACALASHVPDARVYAVDVNTRALELIRRNAEELGLQGRVIPAAPDGVPPEVVFDQIWSNPPIRIGKPALHQLLRTWLPRLAPDGVAWLVVARNLGGDSLAEWLTGEGWQVRRHASQKGYRVLAVGQGR
ncbi:MAG: class I SAM-dependent methyltransferase [Micromonosporaceae bacterium]